MHSLSSDYNFISFYEYFIQSISFATKNKMKCNVVGLALKDKNLFSDGFRSVSLPSLVVGGHLFDL